MGAPDPSQRALQQQWIADTIQTTKEQGIDQGDLGRQLLLSIASEIGVWKVLSVLVLFLLATVSGTVFGVLKLFRRQS